MKQVVLNALNQLPRDVYILMLYLDQYSQAYHSSILDGSGVAST